MGQIMPSVTVITHLNYSGRRQSYEGSFGGAKTQGQCEPGLLMSFSIALQKL